MKKQSAIATTGATVVLESPIIRPMGKLEKLFVYGADDSVTLVKDSKLSAPELVAFLSERVQKLGSESVRLANTLRLARMLPKVKEGEREVDAFRWVTDRLKADSATVSAFQNIAYLVPAIDVKEANGLTVSPFAVKNALGWLKDKDVIDDKGKFKPAAVADPVVKLLNTGIGASKLAAELKELRKPTPPATPVVTTGAPTGAPEVNKGEDTPAKVALDLRVILSRVEKLNVSLGVDKVRSEITGSVRDLAKLAGFDLVPIK